METLEGDAGGLAVVEKPRKRRARRQRRMPVNEESSGDDGEQKSHFEELITQLPPASRDAIRAAVAAALAAEPGDPSAEGNSDLADFAAGALSIEQYIARACGRADSEPTDNHE